MAANDPNPKSNLARANRTQPSPQYSPHNPHPLSTMKTELVWDGKYDEIGNRREVDVAGSAMPLQRIETIDQPRSEAAAAGQLDAFEKKTTRLDDFHNMLIWGDNKLAMASLLKDFKGKIDLIYIDPPFDVGADFTMNVLLGDEKDTTLKDQSLLEMVAYRDTWGKGIDSYLHVMYERLILMRDLLSENGCIYVHCDWHVSYLLRSLLDDVFNKTNCINELIWKRKGGSANPQNRYGVVTDTILAYSKSNRYVFNHQHTRKSEETTKYISERFRYMYEGRTYMLAPIERNAALGVRPNLIYEYNGYTPQYGWMVSRGRLIEFDSEGKLHWNKKGRPNRRVFLDEYRGQPVENLWSDIFVINPMAHEREDFVTQKPEALIERILLTSSEKGNLVADFFCGSGTTGVAAERLGRRWIMADLGRFAIHISRKRLIELQRGLHVERKPYRAFDVYNLGRYERQWWQMKHLNGADEEHRRVVLEFFRAEVLNPDRSPSPLIHGRKGPALCHVDGIDSIFTRDEATEVAKVVAQTGGRECYCLAWEFEMDLRLTTAALEKEYGVKLKLIQIPREIMEKNRQSPPPFLEVAVLEAEPVYRQTEKGKAVDIKLTQFLPSLAEVPTKELEAIKERAIRSGFDFIDFWAVDFDWHPGMPFNHYWQDYRTRKDRSLKTVSEAGFVYPNPGTYTACVKVVDTFGCDTSITVEVTV